MSSWESRSNTTTEEPTTRSRTLLFLSIRSSSARPAHRLSRYTSYDPDLASAGPIDEESQGLLSSEQPSNSHKQQTLPPKWIDLSAQVQDILAQARIKIATLDKLHAKHVLPGFADRSAEERDIERMTTDITRDFRQCQALIQQITPASAAAAAAAPHTFPPTSGKPSRQELLTAQNVQRGLAAKVQDLSGAFRKKQRVYMQKLQGHAIKNQDLLVASGAISLKGPDSLNAVEEDVEATRSQLSKQQQQLQQHHEPDIQMRTHEVTEIAKSISSLAELFKDLSSLVIDQGTILDSIEYNIEQTNTHMEEAVKHLDVATRYQKNTGRRKCIFLLVLIIFGLIMVLIFKPRRSRATSASTSTPPTQGTELGASRDIARRDYARMFAAVALDDDFHL